MKWIELEDCADETQHGSYKGTTSEETEVLEVTGGCLVKVCRVIESAGGRTASMAMAFVPEVTLADFIGKAAAKSKTNGS